MRRAAFTLVEMLLVLVILAVLAAIVIPKFAGRSQQAKESAAKADISNFSVASMPSRWRTAFTRRAARG